ncbi:Peroxiredoxin-like 2A [Labeo rohita]|uniref:Peroxiredoxin-like 2A n=1 Tax=Labeo rohita TaxID=84645 RepID=A0ABQ8M453_LABRO|nr:Peroxiredoxin-like 2A [Labeo rohita]
MGLRPMRLTLLSPRGRFFLCVNSVVKYRVSVSQSPQLLAFDKTVVTHNLPPKYLPLTISTCRPAFKTLVLPTSVNCICLRAFSTNRHFSRESQNSQSPFRKTKESTSVLEGETLAMGMWSLGLGAVGAAIAGIILANTDFLLTKPAPATVQYLGNADLKTIDSDEKTLKAKALWEKSGAEAAELSSLKPQLDELGVPLYAVVKENRKMGVLGFIRLGVWQNFIRAWKSGFQGNMNGEGFILGGVFVIGSGEQGVLLEHREKEFGDKVSIESVLEAAKKIVVEK